MQVRVQLDSAQVRQAIRRASDDVLDRVMPKAITRTAFEVRDAEAEHVGRVFTFSGASTRRFLAGKGAFRVNGARADRLVAQVFPAPVAERVLEDHVEGEQITASEGGRLAYGKSLAVPIEAKRSARGRVPKRLLPSEVTKETGRGFRIGGVLFMRMGARGRKRRKGDIGGRDSRLKALYALVRRAKLKPRFRFYPVAKTTAEREFPAKARQEFAKAARR